VKKPTAPQCHAMTTYFIQAYNENVGKQPVVNRNKARWGFESVLMDYTPAQAKELIDYYLDSYADPSLEWFLWNYEKVEESYKDAEKERQSVAKRRKETQERLEQWRKKKEQWKKK
jgi:hypothetical protein